jgi:ubiquinone/menaquinone biosynthesis C-methylase UbiE
MANSADLDIAFAKHWDVFYDKAGMRDGKFNWLADYVHLRHVVTPWLKSKADCILEIGCGNSDLAPGLHADGYVNITATDFSSTCIKNMRAQHPEVQWAVADARSMTMFEDSSFDVVIEKGCLDAVAAREDGLSSKASNETVKDVHRVLRPGGTFVLMSFSTEHSKDVRWPRAKRWELVASHEVIHPQTGKCCGSMHVCRCAPCFRPVSPVVLTPPPPRPTQEPQGTESTKKADACCQCGCVCACTGPCTRIGQQQRLKSAQSQPGVEVEGAAACHCWRHHGRRSENARRFNFGMDVERHAGVSTNIQWLCRLANLQFSSVIGASRGGPITAKRNEK